MKKALFILVLAAAASAAVIPATEARTVVVNNNDIVQISCAVNYMTALVLVNETGIVKPLVGDSENWVLSEYGTNGAYVKPTIRASGTNVTLIGRSGRHYAFSLSVTATPDIMVYVEAKDAGVANNNSRLYTDSDIEGYRKQLAAMDVQLAKTMDAVRMAKQDGEQKAAVAAAQAPLKISYPYRFEHDKAPFNIRSMHHDGKTTFIVGTPEEMPVVYEEKDGEPKVVNFEYEDGKYVIDKILSKGYLSIGKQKLPFYSR